MRKLQKQLWRWRCTCQRYARRHVNPSLRCIVPDTNSIRWSVPRWTQGGKSSKTLSTLEGIFFRSLNLSRGSYGSVLIESPLRATPRKPPQSSRIHWTPAVEAPWRTIRCTMPSARDLPPMKVHGISRINSLILPPDNRQLAHLMGLRTLQRNRRTSHRTQTQDTMQGRLACR